MLPQKVGMAEALYRKGGAAQRTLMEGIAAVREDQLLLLDVITNGASIPEGNTARREAFEAAAKSDWLNQVAHSSPAVLLLPMHNL